MTSLTQDQNFSFLNADLPSLQGFE